MRVESSQRNITSGVSTLPERLRYNDQAIEQINFRSDPDKKLQKRSSVEFNSVMASGQIGDNDVYLYHSYVRNGEEIQFLYNDQTGTVYRSKDGVFISQVTLPNELHDRNNLKFRTINDSTFIIDPDKLVALNESSDTFIKAAHVNVLVALNYNESVSLKVTDHLGNVNTVTFTVPALGSPEPDYDTADVARATNNVAKELSLLVDALPNVNSSYFGSALSLRSVDSDAWVHVEVGTGQGDSSVKTINKVIENIDGLPSYAIHGTRIKVQPNPTTNTGSYFLEASRVADGNSSSLEEVVWIESRTPDESHTFDETSLPYLMVYDLVSNSFTDGYLPLKDRTRGDNVSVPVPSFVGKAIQDVSYIQNRLLLMTTDTVLLSETNDEFNFWKQSAVQDLATDPIELKSNYSNSGDLFYVIPHNKDLLIVSDTAQFKIDGNSPLLPTTASMVLTTTYDCSTAVRPVAMGNTIMLPITYGKYAGIQMYSGQKDYNRDVATQLTKQVQQYMLGDIVNMTASPNQELLIVKTSNSESNELFVYEQFTDIEGVIQQSSWSKWVLGLDGEILDIKFKDDELSIVMLYRNSDNNNIVTYYSLGLTSPISEFKRPVNFRKPLSTDRVRLDNVIELNLLQTFVDQGRIPLPANYNATDIIVIRGKNQPYNLDLVNFEIESEGGLDYIKILDTDIVEGTIIVGRPFLASYKPTRPFIRDSKNNEIESNRIRIARYNVQVEDTYELKMNIDSEYYDGEDQLFNSRLLGGFKLGEIVSYTGNVVFPYSQNAHLSNVEFYDDSYFPCSISGIFWSGQYFQSSRRI